MILTARLSCRLIRRLRRDDHAQLRAHMDRLDKAARLARYRYLPSASFFDRHAADCFAGDAIVYGSFEAGVLHGVGELHLDPQDPLDDMCAGELAFSVEMSWRHQGIGDKLMRRLVSAARARCVTRLRLKCSSENGAMLALARRHASCLMLDDAGEVTADLHVEQTGTGSRLRETMQSRLDTLVGIFR